MKLEIGKLKYLTIAIFALATASWAQTPSDVIKWQSIKGSGDEFFVYFPEGFKRTQDGGFMLSGRNGGGVAVDGSITVFRYIDGVALIMEYYEGDAKRLQDTNRLSKDIKVKEQREIGEFAFKEAYDDSKNGAFARIQHFRIQNRLYVLKSTKKPEENEIAKAFFESVRLTKNGQMYGPNFDGTDHSKVRLPEIHRSKNSLDESYEEKDLDRLPVSVNKPRMKVGLGQGQGKVKVRVRISPDGLVEKTEIVTPGSAELDRLAVDAAEGSFFIPGERKGMPVGVWKVLEFEFHAPFNITTRVPGQ